MGASRSAPTGLRRAIRGWSSKHAARGARAVLQVNTPTRQLSFRTGRHGRRAAAEARARRRPRLRRWLWLAALLLVLGLAGAGGWRLYTSPWLVISDVRVTGAQTLSPDDLRETAAIAGQRYFTANTAAAAQRLLALPRVQSATVTRTFPHTATIAVIERSPVGVWLSGGVEYVVDAEGAVLDTTNDAGGLPVVDATGASVDLRVGGRVDPDALTIAAAAAQFAPNAVGQHIVRAQYDRDNGLSVTTDRGTLVHLGDSTNLDFKLAVWRQIVAAVPSAGLHELDLRDGDRPYYR